MTVPKRGRGQRPQQGAQLKADAAAKLDDVEAKMDRRADQRDAKLPPARQTGRKLTPPTRSSSPPGRSTTPGWPCWTPSTPAPTRTNSPGRRAPSPPPSLPQTDLQGDLLTAPNRERVPTPSPCVATRAGSACRPRRRGPKVRPRTRTPHGSIARSPSARRGRSTPSEGASPAETALPTGRGTRVAGIGSTVGVNGLGTAAPGPGPPRPRSLPAKQRAPKARPPPATDRGRGPSHRA
jgi:hypothetical protein